MKAQRKLKLKEFKKFAKGHAVIRWFIKKYIFGGNIFLAQSSNILVNFPSDESHKGAICYVNEVILEGP